MGPAGVRIGIMNVSQDRAPKRPVYVRFALWGLNSRTSAILCVCFSLAAAVGSACFRFWPGLMFLAAAGWYWKAIRWVDRHDSWKKAQE